MSALGGGTSMKDDLGNILETIMNGKSATGYLKDQFTIP